MIYDLIKKMKFLSMGANMIYNKIWLFSMKSLFDIMHIKAISMRVRSKQIGNIKKKE